MADKEYWLGSTGPLLYDDGDDVNDPDNIFGGAPPKMAAVVAEGTMKIFTAPSDDEDVVRLEDLKDLLWPIGSVYLGTSATNPGAVGGAFGWGTWTLIGQDRMIIGAGTSYVSGATGGNDTHNHTLGGSADVPSDNTTAGPNDNTSDVPSSNTSGATGVTITGSTQVASPDTDASDANIGINNGTGAAYNVALSTHEHTVDAHSHGVGTLAGSSHQHDLGNHTHTMKNHTHTMKNHTHSLTTGTVNNKTQLPPYYALYIWRRDA